MISLTSKLESILLPIPDSMLWKENHVEKIEIGLIEKVQRLASKTLMLLGVVFLLPIAAAYSLTRYAVSLLSGICAAKTQDKGALAEEEPNLHGCPLPKHVGFSDSFFQSSGLGTKGSATPLEGICTWDDWLDSEHIENKEGIPAIFIDMLKNPKPFIHILKKMEVTAHRFSLEWAVIEPEKGRLNLEAIALYRNFIAELKKEGIEPYVTLHHFTSPQWFGEKGDFGNFEQIGLFVEHSLKMIDLFPEVSNWITFNEPGVYALQSHILGSYPPGNLGNFQKGGTLVRNLLIAHCQVYKAAKERFGDRVSIGITHQWLRFISLNGIQEGNPLETTMCYFLSKIAHYCVYNFFKTGKFSFEIPAFANIHLDILESDFESNNRFLDFIGVQFYGYPRVKAGWNGGASYPGYKVWNTSCMSMGSTCPEGGKALSLGLSFDPQSLNDCLEEAASLGKPIAITETGCDARVQPWGSREWIIDEETQKQYFVQIVPILQKFQAQMKAFFVWTLYRDQLEWDRGTFPKLGVVKIRKGPDGSVNGYQLNAAARFLQQFFRLLRKPKRTTEPAAIPMTERYNPAAQLPPNA